MPNHLAMEHLEIVKRLHAAYKAHVEELKKNRRPTATMIRPPKVDSAKRP